LHRLVSALTGALVASLIGARKARGRLVRRWIVPSTIISSPQGGAITAWRILEPPGLRRGNPVTIR